MTVICGWLASVCAGLEERGEREREGRKKKNSESERETQERQRKGRKPHLCQACFQMDMKTDGQSDRQFLNSAVLSPVNT